MARRSTAPSAYPRSNAMPGMGVRLGRRPQLPTIRTPTGLANPPAPGAPPPRIGGAPLNQGADPFNRPITASPLGPQPVAPGTRTPAFNRWMTPAGNVGAAGPVSGATVPTPPPMATVQTPPAIRPQLR